MAALEHGVGLKPCVIIVGPGNRYVTAAKSIVNGLCGIDMLAGPSEVPVIADESADPEVVAADLLAQAEHDVEARPILVTAHASVIDAGSPHPPNHWRVPGYVHAQTCEHRQLAEWSHVTRCHYWLEVFEMVPPPWRQIQLSRGSRQKSQRFLVACQRLLVASGSSMLRQESRGAVCP